MAFSFNDGLCIPQDGDFESIALMKAAAFAEKSWTPPEVNAIEIAATLWKYAETSKLAHCRVYKDESGRVLGGIQLQLTGDSGDFDLPPIMQHQLRPGEAYVEWIACHPGATGKGIGTRLLKWADSFAASEGAAFRSSCGESRVSRASSLSAAFVRALADNTPS
jgi:GNAT superfamily N-acetyltransferase